MQLTLTAFVFLAIGLFVGWKVCSVRWRYMLYVLYHVLETKYPDFLEAFMTDKDKEEVTP